MSRARMLRRAGRAIAQRNSVPKHMRSHAVPAGPIAAITLTESALETWISIMAATAIDHGGIPVPVPCSLMNALRERRP
ncbi:hypothetical protein GCM10009847_11000 [Leucobacter tardus]